MEELNKEDILALKEVFNLAYWDVLEQQQKWGQNPAGEKWLKEKLIRFNSLQKKLGVIEL